VAEYKHDKPSIVVETNTIIYPNAMMIKLFYANITHAAVFRPCWLYEFAGLAFVLFLIHDVII
jgi:hypothetical protein